MSWARRRILGEICVGDSKSIGDIKIIKGSVEVDGMETNVDDSNTLLCLNGGVKHIAKCLNFLEGKSTIVLPIGEWKMIVDKLVDSV